MTSNVVAHVLRDTFSTEDRSEWAPHGCGGMWRRRQIDGILRRHGVEPVDLELPPPASTPRQTAPEASAQGPIRHLHSVEAAVAGPSRVFLPVLWT